MGDEKVKDSACETQSNQNIVEMVGEDLLTDCFSPKKSTVRALPVNLAKMSGGKVKDSAHAVQINQSIDEMVGEGLLTV